MKSRWMLLLGALSLTTLATACVPGETTANPTAMCSYVIGDGQDGRDATIKRIVYPGGNVDHNDETEEVVYVPCNERNYLVNDGSRVNANGVQVGDRFTPAKGSTKSNTPVGVYYDVFWTLNQGDVAMRRFYDLCYKYECYSRDSSTGAANFSTPGWNGLLGENFGTSTDGAIATALKEFDDSIWTNKDPLQFEELGKAASELFRDKVALRTGYDLDLFCGSGSSGWPTPNKPGEGEFRCTTVRIVITDVISLDDKSVEQAEETRQAEQARSANADRLEAAIALYGPNAAYWLGLQDTLAQCGPTTTCVVTIGTPPDNQDTTPITVVPNNQPTSTDPPTSGTDSAGG